MEKSKYKTEKFIVSRMSILK